MENQPEQLTLFDALTPDFVPTAAAGTVDDIVDGTQGESWRSIAELAPRRPRAVEAPKPEKSGRPEDFGEKIGGARKDLWATRGLIVGDLEGMTERERKDLVKKAAVWPTRKWADIEKSGIPLEVVYLRKLVRDACPTKPVRLRGESAIAAQERYIRFVGTLRDEVESHTDTWDIDELANLPEKKGWVQSAGSYLLRSTGDGEGLLVNRLLKALRRARDPQALRQEAVRKGFLQDPVEHELRQWALLKVEGIEPAKDDRVRVSVSGAYAGSFWFPAQNAETLGIEPGAWFAYRSGKSPAFFGPVGATEAKEGLKRHVEGLVKKSATRSGAKRRGKLTPAHLASVERSGPDVRGLDGMGQERHATGDDYLTDFAFRGGEFGNWVSSTKERQAVLDFGYDAFSDIACALQISDQDVSLGGQLSIAFGARGHGNAVAHYEPGRTVINITRMRGAGSLAHEWFHALDDYVGTRAGLTGFATEAGRNARGAEEGAAEALRAVRDVVDAMKWREVPPEEVKSRRMQELAEIAGKVTEQLVKAGAGAYPDADRETVGMAAAAAVEAASAETQRGAALKAMRDQYLRMLGPIPRPLDGLLRMNSVPIAHASSSAQQPLSEIEPERCASDFYLDAKALDGSYSKAGHNGYWSSDVELFARAGAAWVKDLLEDRNIRDDYLCAHAEQAVPVDGGEAHVDPQGEDRERIARAMQDMVVTLKRTGFLRERDVPIAVLDGWGVVHFTMAPEVDDGEIVSLSRTQNAPAVEGMAFNVPTWDGDPLSPAWLEYADEITAVDMSEELTPRLSCTGWFEGCRKLASADLSGLPVGSVVAGMFEGCDSLSGISPAGIGEVAFKLQERPPSPPTQNRPATVRR